MSRFSNGLLLASGILVLALQVGGANVGPLLMHGLFAFAFFWRENLWPDQQKQKTALRLGITIIVCGLLLEFFSWLSNYLNPIQSRRSCIRSWVQTCSWPLDSIRAGLLHGFWCSAAGDFRFGKPMELRGSMELWWSRTAQSFSVSIFCSGPMCSSLMARRWRWRSCRSGKEWAERKKVLGSFQQLSSPAIFLRKSHFWPVRSFGMALDSFLNGNPSPTRHFGDPESARRLHLS